MIVKICTIIFTQQPIPSHLQSLMIGFVKIWTILAKIDILQSIFSETDMCFVYVDRPLTLPLPLVDKHVYMVCTQSLSNYRNNFWRQCMSHSFRWPHRDGRNYYTEIFRTPAAFFLQLLELRHQHEPSEKNPIPKSNLLSEVIDKLRWQYWGGG